MAEKLMEIIFWIKSKKEHHPCYTENISMVSKEASSDSYFQQKRAYRPWLPS